MKEIHLTKSAEETQKIGEDIAKELRKVRPLKFSRSDLGAVVFGLKGDLGGGKTTFTQGFAKGLGIKDKILSPTFVILKRFEIKDKQFKNFYHIDCYRLKNKKDLLELGFNEIISDPKSIVLIEWPEKILLKDAIIIEFEFVDENKRKIKY